MQIRDYSLPPGWFPRDSASVSGFLSEFDSNSKTSDAAIAPHAGWYYSGRIAARAVSCLKSDAETVIVLGGHLPARTPPLFAMEDAVKTPFGSILIDKELRSVLMKELDGEEDNYRDNTIEVLLPMVHYFFPKAKILWLRLPAEIQSFNAGAVISAQAAKLQRKVNVLSSTDLTHYGLNYGFSPHGSGQEALRWVREVNDAKFIKAVESGNKDEVLRLAEHDRSSCSAGAVLGVMGFAAAGKDAALKIKLLEYGTSADADDGEIPNSFVGYAAMAYVAIDK
ncbi:MAG: AmmeMemoRadiSam system protein B [Treponema sp.]|nr:AmmeMemoRadiSam system protein B [Treponema sp.]